jgi:hypothetical protein
MEKLQNLSNDKLIQVVKNYRQYGYDVDTRNAAIDELKTRGISEEMLQVTGNQENDTYQRSVLLYKSFLNKTRWGLVCYLLLLVFRFGYASADQKLALVLIVVLLAILLCFFVLLIQSFFLQADFYKLIGNKMGSDAVLLYLVLGLPFYFVLFFYFRKQMREKMNEIQ